MWTDEEQEIFDLITELADKMEQQYGLPLLDTFSWIYDMQEWRDSIIDPIEEDE